MIACSDQGLRGHLAVAAYAGIRKTSDDSRFVRGYLLKVNSEFYLSFSMTFATGRPMTKSAAKPVTKPEAEMEWTDA